MAAIILSGVGGSNNWLPFIVPIICILACLYGAEATVKYIRNRKVKNSLHSIAGDNNELTEDPNHQN